MRQKEGHTHSVCVCVCVCMREREREREYAKPHWRRQRCYRCSHASHPRCHICRSSRFRWSRRLILRRRPGVSICTFVLELTSKAIVKQVNQVPFSWQCPFEFDPLLEPFPFVVSCTVCVISVDIWNHVLESRICTKKLANEFDGDFKKKLKIRRHLSRWSPCH